MMLGKLTSIVKTANIYLILLCVLTQFERLQDFKNIFFLNLNSTNCPNKNERIRFTPQADFIFLEEVLCIDSMEHGQDVFNKKTRKGFTIRALRVHLNLLLKKNCRHFLDRGH